MKGWGQWVGCFCASLTTPVFWWVWDKLDTLTSVFFVCGIFKSFGTAPATPAVKRYCIITICLPCGKFDWPLNTKRTGFWSCCVSGAYFLIYYLDKKKMVCNCRERHIASSSTIPLLSTLGVTRCMQLSVDKHAPLGERTVRVCAFSYPATWAATCHFWMIYMRPVLEGGCCDARSLSWAEDRPTWLCGV